MPSIEHTEEAKEELQVLLGRRQRKRIDGEVPRLLADVEIRSAEDRRQRLEAAADIEDVGQRRVLLCVLEKKVAEIRFATARSAQNECVRHFAVVQIQEVGRAVVGFKHRQIFRAEVRVRLLARQDGEQKRQVGVVGVQQIQPAEVQRIVAGNGGEVGVELVVGLGEQIAVRIGEDAGELANELIEFRAIRSRRTARW